MTETKVTKEFGLSCESPLTSSLTDQQLAELKSKYPKITYRSKNNKTICAFCGEPIPSEAVLSGSAPYFHENCKPLAHAVQSIVAKRYNLRTNLRTFNTRPFSSDIYKSSIQADLTTLGMSEDQLHISLKQSSNSALKQFFDRCNYLAITFILRARKNPQLQSVKSATSHSINNHHVNPALKGFTSRVLLQELKDRGYRWSDLHWLEHKVIKHVVKL